MTGLQGGGGDEERPPPARGQRCPAKWTHPLRQGSQELILWHAIPDAIQNLCKHLFHLLASMIRKLRGMVHLASSNSILQS